jgi:hypothetical protein
MGLMKHDLEGNGGLVPSHIVFSIESDNHEPTCVESL